MNMAKNKGENKRKNAEILLKFNIVSINDFNYLVVSPPMSVNT